MSINETSNTMQTSNDCSTIPTKVVIELFGGCVSKVTADNPLEVVVLDLDYTGEGGDLTTLGVFSEIACPPSRPACTPTSPIFRPQRCAGAKPKERNWCAEE